MDLEKGQEELEEVGEMSWKIIDSDTLCLLLESSEPISVFEGIVFERKITHVLVVIDDKRMPGVSTFAQPVTKEEGLNYLARAKETRGGNSETTPR